MDFIRTGMHAGLILVRDISPPYPKGWVIRYYYVGSRTEAGAQYHSDIARSSDTRQVHGGKWLPSDVLQEIEKRYDAENPKSRPKLKRPSLEQPSPAARPKLKARPRLAGR